QKLLTNLGSMKDLTVSNIDRQNVLNNHIALQAIQDYIGLSGMFFNEEYVFSKEQIEDFYKITPATIERYLESNELELEHNGYQVLKGKKLKEFKDQFGAILNISSKTSQLGIFNFRAFLNLG